MLLIVCRFKGVKRGTLLTYGQAATPEGKCPSAPRRQPSRRRKALGISQEELADLAGLHRTYVGSIERGERNVSIDNIERLADALELDVVDMLTR